MKLKPWWNNKHMFIIERPIQHEGICTWCYKLSKHLKYSLIHTLIKTIFKKKKKLHPIVHAKMDMISLQISLGRNSSNSSYTFLLNVNFENLTIRLRFLYVYNMHVKFHSNQMLFTNRSINLFYTWFKAQKLEI